jgi:predicted unusual protein kinase regulating ubiquinone biosynthesis (AarF/ABC1/UbiB family)
VVRTFFKIIAHAGVVAWTLCRHFLFPILIRGSGSAHALRLSLESLGSNWVRLGQALALRFDILPDDLCSELLRIQSDIRPFAYAEVKRIVEREFGQTPERLFAAFDEAPFAVTSSGQLHKAITSAGEHLVVKVQREETSQVFRVQSTLMQALAAAFDVVSAFGTKAFSKAVSDFRQQRASELSFAIAATNARKMAALAEGDPSELNVKISNEYSGRRVLSWEFIDGAPVASIVGSIRAAKPDQPSDSSRRGYDLDRIARQIYRNALNQIFRDGVFHVDISAASLLVLPAGSIAYVDFALVERLGDERQRLLQAYYESLLQGQVDNAVDKLIQCAQLPPSFDNAELRRALAVILEDRLDGFRSPEGSVPHKIAQNTYLSLMSAFCQSEIALPVDLSIYFRTMLTIESLVFELCPDFDAVAEQSRFFSLAAKQDYKQSLELPQVIDEVAKLYQDAVELVSDLRHLHSSAQAIDVSMRTLRIRLIQYGFWAVLVAVCAFFGLRDKALLEATVAKPFVLPIAFLLVALFLINRIWRQSRQLSRVDRAIVGTRQIPTRSLGRVR